MVSFDGDPASFVPSHLREISDSEQWLVDHIARQFIEDGTWPRLDRLTREAAQADIELPDIIWGMPIQDFIWRPDNDGTLVLSIPGLWRSVVGKSFVDQFLKVALLCRDIYLDPDAAEPILTSNDLRETLGFDDETIAKIRIELAFEYFLTSGGGAKSDVEWFLHVNQTVRKLRDVTTIGDYFEERAKIVAPKLPSEPWPPITQLSTVSGLQSVFASEPTREQPPVDPRQIFVVHGRDVAAKDAMWEFLEDLGLHPLDWNEMVRRTGRGTPHTLYVVETGFSMAQAFVVLMTPDDEARLHDDLTDSSDTEDETRLTCQPRPNVMFEAGRAFGTKPERTILVHIGKLRRVSDLDGLNVVRIGRTKAPLLALADRLEAAGCPIDRHALDLFDPCRFVDLPSHRRVATKAESSSPAGPRVGRILPKHETPPPTPRLVAKLWSQGDRSHLLEISNRGNVALKEVAWSLPDTAPNWTIMVHALPQYPIAILETQKHVRVPVSVSMGGPVYVDLTIRGLTESGEPYETIEQLSVYG